MGGLSTAILPLYRNGDTRAHAEGAGSGSLVRSRISDSLVSTDIDANVGLSPEFSDFIENGPAEKEAAAHNSGHNLTEMIARTISLIHLVHMPKWKQMQKCSI